jgi:hypothetical protein
MSEVGGGFHTASVENRRSTICAASSSSGWRRAYREFVSGKGSCADGCLYLHDGNAWSFFRTAFVATEFAGPPRRCQIRPVGRFAQRN